MRDLMVCVTLIAEQVYWDVRHRVHFRRHPDLHRRSCTCRGTGTFGPPYYYPDYHARAG